MPRIVARWAGLRSFVEDRLLVVGFDPRVPHFFWLAGQGGHGIQTSPAVSRLAAALFDGDPVPADIADLGIDAVDAGADPFRALVGVRLHGVTAGSGRWSGQCRRAVAGIDGRIGDEVVDRRRQLVDAPGGSLHGESADAERCR